MQNFAPSDGTENIYTYYVYRNSHFLQRKTVHTLLAINFHLILDLNSPSHLCLLTDEPIN